ncbi:MAG: 2-hydroxy-3-keto-5-methylthiopentenyl-1-phosphate phosphatase [Ignavibacteriaceae bacterium]|nr:2-hydroxy-3-keto-5-methylthiopentenyl-1-phosphate phosphatase [Ignavibacteriaceae bacterium]MBZ0196616.1 MtnX-like HAD-IB family phosphatase [Ignavibacteriaceae bacterium]
MLRKAYQAQLKGKPHLRMFEISRMFEINKGEVPRVFKVFIDFDGTITKEDVGANIFTTFGDTEKANEIIHGFRDGSLTAFETWEELLKTLKITDEATIKEFAAGFQIDKSFHPFIDFLKAKGIKHYIVSDGFAFYIDAILNREGLQIPYFANELIFKKGGGVRMEFPHRDEHCTKCANCKRNHVVALSGDDEFSVYIGNGNSDVCPALHCDYIFAKDTLLKYCEKNRVSYYPFRNFGDVQARMNELLNKKRPKKRHRAELNRKKLYMQG